MSFGTGSPYFSSLPWASTPDRISKNQSGGTQEWRKAIYRIQIRAQNGALTRTTLTGYLRLELKPAKEIDCRLGELQQELLRLANTKNDYTEVADEIYRLREERQAILVQDAECDGMRQRIEEMKAFLEEQAGIPAEYDEQLVRRLIDKVKVFDEKITVKFKSGVEIVVEK